MGPQLTDQLVGVPAGLPVIAGIPSGNDGEAFGGGARSGFERKPLADALIVLNDKVINGIRLQARKAGVMVIHPFGHDDAVRLLLVPVSGNLSAEVNDIVIQNRVIAGGLVPTDNHSSSRVATPHTAIAARVSLHSPGKT